MTDFERLYILHSERLFSSLVNNIVLETFLENRISVIALMKEVMGETCNIDVFLKNFPEYAITISGNSGLVKISTDDYSGKYACYVEAEGGTYVMKEIDPNIRFRRLIGNSQVCMVIREKKRDGVSLLVSPSFMTLVTNGEDEANA